VGEQASYRPGLLATEDPISTSPEVRPEAQEPVVLGSPYLTQPQQKRRYNDDSRLANDLPICKKARITLAAAVWMPATASAGTCST
jgi:hypothetical protein